MTKISVSLYREKWHDINNIEKFKKDLIDLVNHEALKDPKKFKDVSKVYCRFEEESIIQSDDMSDKISISVFSIKGKTICYLSIPYWKKKYVDEYNEGS